MLAGGISLLGLIAGVSLTWALGREKPAGRHTVPVLLRYAGLGTLTAALFAAALWRLDGGAGLIRALVLVCALVSLAVTDLTRGLLPNAITAPASAAGLLLSAFADPGGWWTYPASALLVGCWLLAVASVYPGGMGMGDVKMGAMLGAFLGPYAALAVFLGALTGAAVGGALILLGVVSRDTGLPFGVFLALGALVCLFFGPEMWEGYRALL